MSPGPPLPPPWHCVHPSLMTELLYLEMPGAFPSYLGQETPWNPVIIVLWDCPTPEAFSDPTLFFFFQIPLLCINLRLGTWKQKGSASYPHLLAWNKALSSDRWFPCLIYPRVTEALPWPLTRHTRAQGVSQDQRTEILSPKQLGLLKGRETFYIRYLLNVCGVREMIMYSHTSNKKRVKF